MTRTCDQNGQNA